MGFSVEQGGLYEGQRSTVPLLWVQRARRRVRLVSNCCRNVTACLNQPAALLMHDHAVVLLNIWRFSILILVLAPSLKPYLCVPLPALGKGFCHLG